MGKYNSFFDAVICVNLARRSKRWQNVQGELAKLKSWPFADLERFVATDCLRLDIPKRVRISDGSYGCNLTYRRVLESCLKRMCVRVLILQDDIAFHPDFEVQLDNFLPHVPSFWRGMHFGGDSGSCGDPLPNATRLNEHVSQTRYILGCHAIALQEPGISKLSELLSTYFEYEHFDRIITKMQQSHWYCPNETLISSKREEFPSETQPWGLVDRMSAPMGRQPRKPLKIL